MASTKFPRKEFEKYVKLTKEVEEKISMLGTHLESATEEEIELEILPNRPDLFSLQGFMRSFLPFIAKGKKKEYKINKGNYKIIVDKSVSNIRPYSMAAIVKNIKFTDEKIKDVMQWQEKIHATLGRNRKKIALGYYILDKIKFPVVYKALEPEKIIFEPLDMPEKMNAIQILQRHPTGREYAKQLERFNKFPVYLDSNNEVLSMPPIINSHPMGKIDSDTKNILIECSGTDLETLKKVISMAVIDLIDCGGEAYSVDVLYGNKKESIDLKPEKMKLDIENVNKLLGTNLKEADIKKLLEKMNHEYSKGQVTFQCYRTDIMHEVDLIEDIAIAYGYQNFIPILNSNENSIGNENKREILKRKIAEILSGLEMIENSSFHLVSKDDLKKNNIKKAIEVEDSKTDYNFLRPDMLISSMKVLGDNVDAEYPQKIFEISPVFIESPDSETGISEPNKLVVSIVPGNFTEIKQILEYLRRMLGKELKMEEASNPCFIEGRAVKIKHNNKEIGILGEVSPQIIKNWRIKMPVASLEINIDELLD